MGAGGSRSWLCPDAKVVPILEVAPKAISFVQPAYASVDDSAFKDFWEGVERVQDGVGLALKTVVWGLKGAGAPFGGIALAELLTSIYGAACQATSNRANCRYLIALIMGCGEALAKKGALELLKTTQQERLQNLTVVLQDARDLVSSFGHSNPLLRVIRHSSDAVKFTQVHAALSKCMLALGLVQATDFRLQPKYVEESEHLVSVVCDLGGSSNRQQALQNLCDRGGLLELRECTGSMSDQAWALTQDSVQAEAKARDQARARETEELRRLVQRQQLDFEPLRSLLSQLTGQAQALPVPEYLQEWWSSWLARAIRTVDKHAATSEEFLQALVNWAEDAGANGAIGADQVQAYQSRLQQRPRFLAMLEGADIKPDDEGMLFKAVAAAAETLLRLVDTDETGRVTRGGLLLLHLKASAWVQQSSPAMILGSMVDLVMAVFEHFNWQAGQQERQLRGDGKLQLITRVLQGDKIIASYNLPHLANQHHPSTHQWLCDQVKAWLLQLLSGPQVSTPRSSPGPTAAQVPRMCLLLAEPGLGKTVFSAFLSVMLDAHAMGTAPLRQSGASSGRRASAPLMLDAPPAPPARRSASIGSISEAMKRLSSMNGSNSNLMLALSSTFLGGSDSGAASGAAGGAISRGTSSPLPLAPAQGTPESPRATGRLSNVGALGPAGGKPLSIIPEIAPASGAVGELASQDLVVVRHFFRAGDRRGQGRSFVLCLVQQLSEKLHGFAEQLVKVIDEHGDGLQIGDLQHFCTKFLLVPLAELHRQREMRGSGLRCPRVLLLLDGIDEADDSSIGISPVARLIAEDFLHLPAWISIFVTCRPQSEGFFLMWAPKRLSIDVQEPHTQEDMRTVLQDRLAPLQLSGEDLRQAVEELMGSSKGRFAYVDLAVQVLTAVQAQAARTSTPGGEGRLPWSTLRQHLPGGGTLQSLYLYSLAQLQAACGGDHKAKWELLARKVLPVLAVCREPLSVTVLASIVGKESEAVQAVVGLLVTLFPLRDGRLTPHDPGLQGWLVKSAPYLRSEFGIEVAEGHAYLVRACWAVLQHYPDPATLKPSKRADRRAQASDEDLGECSSPLKAYALRHGMVHACMAGEQELLLDFRAWNAIDAADHGRAVLEDMMMCQARVPKPAVPLVEDVIRWLSHCSSELATYVNNVLGTALTCPVQSHVFRAAEPLALGRPAPEAQWRTASTVGWNEWSARHATMKGHAHWVTSAAFSPDGSRVATSSRDNTIRVWTSVGGTCLGVLAGHWGPVNGVAFSPVTAPGGNLLLASASTDRTVCLWDASDSKLPRTAVLQHPKEVNGVAFGIFSPIGAKEPQLRLATACTDHVARIWDVSTRSCMHELARHAGPVLSVAFSRDGAKLATASEDGTVRLWKAASGQILSLLQEDLGIVRCVVFHPDGNGLATASCDKSVRVIRLEAGNIGRCVATLKGHTGWVSCVAFNSDGSRLASGSYDKTSIVWDLSAEAEPQQLSRATGHSGAVRCVAFSADGSRLVTASQDKTACIWNTTAADAAQHGHTGAVNSIAFSPSGKLMATASQDRTVCIWDVRPGDAGSLPMRRMAVLREHNSTVRSVAFNPTGTLLATAGENKAVHIYAITPATPGTGASNASFRLTATLPPQGLPDQAMGVVHCVTFSPDGSLLATASKKGKAVRIWQVRDGETFECVAKPLEHEDVVESVAFSMDGTKLASACHDKLVHIWRVSKDGTYAERVAKLDGHSGHVNSVTFSPNGAVLASASSDRTARIWYDWDSMTATYTRCAELHGHTGSVCSVAFSPDGRKLATGSCDNTVRVWDAASGRCIATLRGHAKDVKCVAFSPAGKLLASAGEDKVTRVWTDEFQLSHPPISGTFADWGEGH